MIIMSLVYKWINSGKQLGKVYSFKRNGEICWSSVGVQLWEGNIKVYIDEIYESQMNEESFSKEETQEFDEIEEALAFIEKHTLLTIDDLKPCKGSKIFNPKF